LSARSATRWLTIVVVLLLAAASDVGAQAAPDQPRSKRRALQHAIGRASAAREQKKVTDQYDPSFKKYTKRYFGPAFDWRVFKAQAMAESELNPRARSHVGARGLMQLMPSTFGTIQSARPEFTSIDDPEWNIAAGIMHDRYLWTLWKNQPDDERRRFMVGSYNAGEGTISRACSVARLAQLDDTRWPNIEQVAPKVQRWRYRETVGYVRKIEANYDTLKKSR
jgi:soluble lytic murein transglycosylase-like protein